MPAQDSMVRIAPSILSADFANLGRDVQEAEAGGADYIHVDVMDGQFVPNLSMGPVVVQAVRRATKLPLDVHLMVEAPERFVAEFARAGADFLTVHVEASKHLHRTVQQIRELGVRPGVTLNPATALETLWEILPYVHMVLVMTVNPGFGGQGFIPTMNDKVARLAAMIRERNPEVEIEVDGGIDAETVPGVVRAGAKVLVAGTAVFKHPAGIAGGIADLRRAAGSAASGGVPAKVAAS